MPNLITTHVLDTAVGRPAAGIEVTLSRIDDGQASVVGQGTTDVDGRIMTGLITPADFAPGVFQIRFQLENYSARQNTEPFYPEVTITFRVAADQTHYHVPLLLSPFGYTTYRGS